MYMLWNTGLGTGGALAYPDAVCCALLPATVTAGAAAATKSNMVACVYSDRSLIVWDATNEKSVTRYRSLAHHVGCVWDLEMVPSVTVPPLAAKANSSHLPLPEGTFITCSADNTIRFWNLDSPVASSASKTVNDPANQSGGAVPESLLKMLFIGTDVTLMKVSRTLLAHEQTAMCIIIIMNSLQQPQIASSDRRDIVLIAIVVLCRPGCRACGHSRSHLCTCCCWCCYC